jgi:hypothetical protein
MSQVGNGSHGLVSQEPRMGSCVARDVGELEAKLPVAGMNEGEWHVRLSGISGVSIGDEEP